MSTGNMFKMSFLNRKPASGILILILLRCTLCLSEVHELNKDNIDKFRRGKLLVVIFVDSPTCNRCRILYPYFVAASQSFPSDPEIFFGRVFDKRLVQDWGITELPALVTYRGGMEESDFFLVDITVDDIIDEIARRLHGNFGGLDRSYAVEVTSQNFREIVKTPKQNVLLLTYDKNSMAEMKVMEQVAKIFRNDDGILICKLNVDKEQALRDNEYKSRDVPAVFWYGARDKRVPKRFGGNISIYMQTTFINEQTGLNRNPDGSMQPTSGRLKRYDDLILEQADSILTFQTEAVGQLASQILIEKPSLQRHEQEFSNYYVFLLEKISVTGNMKIIDSQLEDINNKLDENQDLFPKQEEMLKRKRNIVYFFKGLHIEHEKQKKEKEEKRKKEEQERAEKEKEKREEVMKKNAETKKIPVLKRMGQPPQYTAQAILHPRVHEEL